MGLLPLLCVCVYDGSPLLNRNKSKAIVVGAQPAIEIGSQRHCNLLSSSRQMRMRSRHLMKPGKMLLGVIVAQYRETAVFGNIPIDTFGTQSNPTGWRD